MSAGDAPRATQVQVRRYDVNLTLDDILTPLMQTAANRMQPAAGAAGAAMSPELAQHLQTFSDLVSQLRDVVGKINQLDPTVLAPGHRPPSGG